MTAEKSNIINQNENLFVKDHVIIFSLDQVTHVMNETAINKEMLIIKIFRTIFWEIPLFRHFPSYLRLLLQNFHILFSFFLSSTKIIVSYSSYFHR